MGSEKGWNGIWYGMVWYGMTVGRLKKVIRDYTIEKRRQQGLKKERVNLKKRVVNEECSVTH